GDVKERKVERKVEEIETLNLELDHKVTKLSTENEHLKQTYKQLFDSIKSLRVQSKEQCDDLINTVNLKSVEVSDLNASLQEKILVITALKEQLNKLKGKAVLTKAASLNPIDPALLQYSVQTDEPNLAGTTIIEVPKELPKVSMVNSCLKKLKFHLASFDIVVKERTTATAITEGTWGFEHTKACFRDDIIPFVKNLKELLTSFDQCLIDEVTEISQSPRGIFLNQSEYALKSLKKYGMESSDPVDAPIVEKSKLDEDLQGKAVNPTHYRGMVGTLMYLTTNRPDLTFVVCMSFADADHAGCQDTHWSTSGSVQFLGERLISWSSKRQKSAAISSTKAEYIALSGCFVAAPRLSDAAKGDKTDESDDGSDDGNDDDNDEIVKDGSERDDDDEEELAKNDEEDTESEETRQEEEESFDPIPRTPEGSEDEGNDEED
nr:hypothetical protein [Tanacetum cinerariifolium]